MKCSIKINTKEQISKLFLDNNQQLLKFYNIDYNINKLHIIQLNLFLIVFKNGKI